MLTWRAFHSLGGFDHFIQIFAYWIANVFMESHKR